MSLAKDRCNCAIVAIILLYYIVLWWKKGVLVQLPHFVMSV